MPIAGHTTFRGSIVLYEKLRSCIFIFILELHCAHINYIIFADMAQKKKKKAADSPKNKPGKTNPSPFKPDKEERIDWRGLARDERTWKITGAVSLLISIFLFIAFISYFFTWKEDQDKVFRGASAAFFFFFWAMCAKII